MISARNKGWVGIDLGTHSVKLVQTERHGGRIRVAEALVVRRPEPWGELRSESSSTAESAEEIRAGLSLGTGFSGRAAAITLPMSLCEVRSCSVPLGTEHDVRQAISQQLLPMNKADDADDEFDFWDAEMPGERQSQPENALVASLRSEWAQQVARDLSGAKLVGKVLDVLPTALARALEIGSPGISRAPIAAVDWGYRRATLCAVLQGRPLFVRCLRDAGFSSMVSALTKALSLTNEEAQKLLVERGLPPRAGDTGDELQSVIEEVTMDSLNAFLEELNRTIGFLRQQRRALAPTKVVLFGGGAATTNIASYLAERLELPTETWTLEGHPTAGRARIPMEMLGPAVALSALAWSKI